VGSQVVVDPVAVAAAEVASLVEGGPVAVAVAEEARVERREAEAAVAVVVALDKAAVARVEAVRAAVVAVRGAVATGRTNTAGGRPGARQYPPQIPCWFLLQVNWLMGAGRGREARLKAEHAGLYPGLKPGIWTPVEKLLRHVTELIHQDRSRSGVITGRRLLHEDHFEYRGTSARPEGLPAGSTRLSDAGAEPAELQGGPGLLSEHGSVKRKGRRE